MKHYKIAIIGFGTIAQRHLNILCKLFPKEKIIIFRKFYEKKIFPKKNIKVLNIDDLLNYNFENVLITNPSHLHYLYLQKLYKKKINFFIEKPFFDKPKDISEILNFQKKNSLKLQVGYLFRHDDLLNKFKKILPKKYNSNVNVEIVCESHVNDWPKKKVNKINSSISKKTGGGVLNELSHEIDYCLYLFGHPKKLFAMNFNSKKIKDCDTEDQANIIFYYSKNLKVNIKLALNQSSYKRYCLVSDNKGYFYLDFLKRKIEVSNNKGLKHFYSNKSLSDTYITQMVNFFDKRNISYEEVIDANKVIKIINIIKLSNQSNSIINLNETN